jgi:glycosyltransferase involved in cell wall biosynthesis
MKIVILEPYFTGSHATWARAISRVSRHDIEILQLPGRHWKWRMHGAAVELARQYLELASSPDLILASDMMDLACFRALSDTTGGGPPVALYFHENQIVYPPSPRDTDLEHGRDLHYGFINYTSALVADKIFFNSSYHQCVFIDGLRKMLDAMPDFRNRETVDIIENKSSVLPVGIDAAALDKHRPAPGEQKSDPPLILYNHRWEYDKNPDDFFEALYQIDDQGHDFRLAVVGKSGPHSPPCFDEARQKLQHKIVQFGYLESFADYARLLWQADLLPVTSYQDFFGISVMEAIFCETIPLLPDRLAYPVLLDKSEFSRYYYTDKEQLSQKLAGFIDQPPVEAKNELARVAAKYDWEKLMPAYNSQFEKIAQDR